MLTNVGLSNNSICSNCPKDDEDGTHAVAKGIWLSSGVLERDSAFCVHDYEY